MAEKMTTYEKIQAVAVMLSLFAFFTYHLCLAIIFPYIAVIKAEKGDFKETCAYVVGEEKMKYGFQYIIMIDGKYYESTYILPSINEPAIKKKSGIIFPYIKKSVSF